MHYATTPISALPNQIGLLFFYFFFLNGVEDILVHCFFFSFFFFFFFFFRIVYIKFNGFIIRHKNLLLLGGCLFF